MDDKILDKRYQKNFGWSLAEVDALSEKQKNVCAICGRAPKKNRLSLDHDHRFDRAGAQITAHSFYGYRAVTKIPIFGKIFLTKWCDTRKEAKEELRRARRRVSVRGLLCQRCNRALSFLEDEKAPYSPIQRLRNAAQYLEDFEKKLLDNL